MNIPTLKDLDSFTRAYFECALWTSTNERGEPLDGLYTFFDIAPATLGQMIEDCKSFQKEHGEFYRTHGWSDEQAGHDFWLTRNGHGAGFWDRGLGDPGKALTSATRAFGSFDLGVGDDGQIYGS